MSTSIRLPGVGPALHPVALGANHLGSALDQDASNALLDRFVELGGTVIDTALVYANWLPQVERSCSERTIGRWLSSRGSAADVVVGTKGGHPDLEAPGTPRLDPESLRGDIEQSLDHLGLSRLSLWWLHRDDPATPVAEIVEAVEAARGDGLLDAWGVANWSAERISRAQEAARDRGVPGPVADSAGFSLAPPRPGSLAPDLVTLDAALRRFHEQTQLPLVAYSAQAKGWFDKLGTERARVLAPIYDHGAIGQRAALVRAVAARHGLSPTEAALAAVWLLPFPTVAVVGPRTTTQLESCWTAFEADLGSEDAETLRGALAAAVADTVNAPR